MPRVLSLLAAPSKGEIVVALAATGALWGAIIGAIVRHERWAPFALSPRVSFDAGSQRGAIRFGARF